MSGGKRRPTGADIFHNAIFAFEERDNIAPLMDCLRSDLPLSRENRERLAGVFDPLHARSQRRWPGGMHLPKPDYPADEFHNAIMAVHDERNDIAPLLAYLRSDRPLSPMERLNLARLLELLHARTRPLAGGRPGGTLSRWPKADYVVQYLVDARKEAWRREHGKHGVPFAEEEKFVDAAILSLEQVGKQPNRDRVKELLREPKSRRL
jgi:hypothetical protein